MKELVEFIAKSLVDQPDAVEVTEARGQGRTVVNLKVAQADMGKVIGKQGRIAQAIRTLLKVAASRTGGSATQPVLVIGAQEEEGPRQTFAEAPGPELDEPAEEEQDR